VTDTQALIEQMSQPSFYPEHTTRVDVVQTHISCLFLTDRFVYKVKKPVNFGFLDFTSLEKRRHFCKREVSLNSRLSPQTYLGVVGIHEKDGVLSLEGPGEAVDVAVKMVRLPAERMLREVLRRGEATPELFTAIARTLAEFHHEAFTSPEIQAIKNLEGVRFNCEENFQQTEKYIETLVSDETFNFIRTSTDLFFQRKAPLFARRASTGRVVDGHGDLHLDSICATDPVTIFDCIEFNERFRVLDVAEEVAFLAMDLEFSGYPQLAAAFVDAYAQASSDPEMLELLSFYKAYRAYVRAKIHSFQIDDPTIGADKKAAIGATARQYYELAARYASEFNPQRLIITCGLTGTGKSTLARKLGERCAVQVVSSDSVRKEMLGIDPHERHYDAFGHGVYAPSITERTYAAMTARAESLLLVGHSVILDGCFGRRDQRSLAIDLAHKLRVPFMLLECRAPEELIQRRLNGREGKAKSVSDGRWEIYQKQLETFEPPAEVPAERCLVLDRSRPAEVLIDELLAQLPGQWYDRH
jgi:uncharacterized protein